MHRQPIDSQIAEPNLDYLLNDDPHDNAWHGSEPLGVALERGFREQQGLDYEDDPVRRSYIREMEVVHSPLPELDY